LFFDSIKIQVLPFLSKTNKNKVRFPFSYFSRSKLRPAELVELENEVVNQADLVILSAH
jgi:hypothetical protein